MHDRIAYQGITFDDVLLEPGYSEVVPRDVSVQTQLTPSVRLNIPLVSSPMDTVTASELAIALAQEGGIGIIHKNLKVEDQAREVEKVKRSENGIIVDPITLSPDATVAEAREVMTTHHVSGIPDHGRGGEAAPRHPHPPRPEVSDGRQSDDRRRDDPAQPRSPPQKTPPWRRPSNSSPKIRWRNCSWWTICIA